MPCCDGDGGDGDGEAHSCVHSDDPPQTGVDLTYVLCTPEASQAIKGYSPDLIVLPVLPSAGEPVRFVVQPFRDAPHCK